MKMLTNEKMSQVKKVFQSSRSQNLVKLYYPFKLCQFQIIATNPKDHSQQKNFYLKIYPKQSVMLIKPFSPDYLCFKMYVSASSVLAALGYSHMIYNTTCQITNFIYTGRTALSIFPRLSHQSSNFEQSHNVLLG